VVGVLALITTATNLEVAVIDITVVMLSKRKKDFPSDRNRRKSKTKPGED
jgi:hypothetical protein